MAIVEHGDAVDCLYTLDLRGERGVVGRVKVAKSRVDIGLRRRGAVLPDRLAVEIRFGHEAGRVLAGIEARRPPDRG